MGAKNEGERRRLALGRDVRFLLVSVGGGGIRVGREVAQKKIQYLETAAVNCDRRVLEEKLFDRQVFVKGLPGAEDDDGDTTVHDGTLRALAAREKLEGLFEGASCVTIVASLGGGSGSGVLPILLDAATRNPDDLAHLTLYLIRPFHAEERRRRIADQTMANLYFQEGLTELIEAGRAHVFVLDNEETLRQNPNQSFASLVHGYAADVAEHIRKYVSISGVETMVSWLREGQVLGSSVGIPKAAGGVSPSFLSTEQPSLAEAATARLSQKPLGMPAGYTTPGDVEILIESEEDGALAAKPKPLPGPGGPVPPTEKD
ncbi:MAG: hypothetical protein M1144_02150 [Candidatus Thermoplasmatota archaeon]|jgi:hypothetical protein|nr:hypothetical protein [Candidatus Thermoplasmatota archaeon]MCL5984514.1 hypothetical protein [Candidatus Thermoplasmatota archaeon]